MAKSELVDDRASEARPRRRSRCGAALFGVSVVASASAGFAMPAGAQVAPSEAPSTSPPPEHTLGTPPPGAATGGLIIEELDSAGQVVSTQTIEVTDSAPGSRATREAGNGTIGSAGRSGCRYVTGYNTGYTISGNVFYRFNVKEKICWDDGKNTVDVSNIHSYPSHLDRFAVYHGLIDSQNGPYNYAGHGSRSGYQTLRRARIENCVIKYGCIGSDYPYVMLNAHDDGSIYWQRGGD